MNPGTKLYRRDTGEEKVIDYFFIHGYNSPQRKIDDPIKWYRNAMVIWHHSYVWVAFTDRTTDILYNLLETNLYMSEEEYKLFNQTFQPWDEADLVPNPS